MIGLARERNNEAELGPEKLIFSIQGHFGKAVILKG